MDLNNEEYLKLLTDSADSKDGKVIVEFLKGEYDKLDYEDIDKKLPADQKGLEFEAIRKAREIFNKCLGYLK